MGYDRAFLVAGIAALAAAGVFFMMRLPGAHLQRPKFVWNKKYKLYYVLAILFGARKQVFMTFGPWVLIRVFEQPATIFAQLWIIGAVLGLFFQPALGKMIDRFGERIILIADSLCVLVVCVGYGYASNLPDRRLALWLLCSCYIFDQLLFGVNMARSTYLAKIVESPTHIAPTLSLGISMDHLVSMSVPIAGGYIWALYGHAAVFMAAAGVALLMLFFSTFIRLPADH